MSFNNYGLLVAQGLCGMCGKRKRTKTNTCDKCRKHQRKLHDEMYARKRERGECLHCSSPVFMRTSLCKKCKERASMSNKKRYYERKRTGKCVVCGNEALPSILYCGKCKKHQSNYCKKRTRTRIESGVCTSCGKNISEPGFKGCKVCLEKGRGRHVPVPLEKRKHFSVKEAFEKLGIPMPVFAVDGHKLSRQRIHQILQKKKQEKVENAV